MEGGRAWGEGNGEDAWKVVMIYLFLSSCILGSQTVPEIVQNGEAQHEQGKVAARSGLSRAIRHSANLCPNQLRATVNPRFSNKWESKGIEERHLPSLVHSLGSRFAAIKAESWWVSGSWNTRRRDEITGASGSACGLGYGS